MLIVGVISLLKLTLGLSIAGLSLLVAKDMKVVEKLGGLRLTKTIPVFPLGDYHTAVLGASGFGKTYATLKSLAGTKKGVFFFNFQQESVPRGFTTVKGTDDAGQVKELVEAGGKVNFIPNRGRTEASKQLKAVVDLFLKDEQMHNVFIAVDEVHLYDRTGIDAMMQVATAGRRWGVFLIAITQRPANMDNNILTQSQHVVSFNLKENDRKYLQNNSFPVDEMMKRINNEKYKFVIYDGMNVEGAFIIK